jgi:hypothetical protein
MGSAIGTTLLGIVGGFFAWIATNFLGKPLLDFLALRSQVQEEITFTGNVGPMTAHTPEYDEAVESLRRLGAKMRATNVDAQLMLRRPLRWFLLKSGYDLEKAARNLIGLSNAMALPHDKRAGHITSIQDALRLPHDY